MLFFEVLLFVWWILIPREFECFDFLQRKDGVPFEIMVHDLDWHLVVVPCAWWLCQSPVDSTETRLWGPLHPCWLSCLFTLTLCVDINNTPFLSKYLSKYLVSASTMPPPLHGEKLPPWSKLPSHLTLQLWTSLPWEKYVVYLSYVCPSFFFFKLE